MDHTTAPDNQTKLMDSVEGIAEDNQTKLIDSVEGIMRYKDTSKQKLLGEMAFQLQLSSS